MTKIGILSMQRVLNHGSFLQCYSLMKTIKAVGCEVEFIDIEKGEDNSAIVSTRRKEYLYNKKYSYIINRIRMRYKGKKQKELIEKEQIKYLELKEKSCDVAPFDTVVIGSDEVFNCVIPSSWGFSPQLFGDIKDANRVITYAASCGRTNYQDLTPYFVDKIREAFKNIKSFSTRDINTNTFVKTISGVDPLYHLDPVFIYDFDKETIKCKFKKPFLLIYSYSNRINNPIEIAAIKSFALEKGLEIVAAGVFQYWCKNNIVVSSFELLGFFEAAEYVVTDTFHGTVLSVKYGRKFATIIRDSNRNKLEDLLFRFDLLNRKLETMTKLPEVLQEDIDYIPIKQFLEDEKMKTVDYLKKNL